MALTINKPDARGKQQVVAEEDMYLDDAGKLIIVKQGEQVPSKAASVLAMRGGRVPARYAKLVDEAGAKVKPEAEVKSEAQTKAKPPSEASGTNPKKTEEKPAA